MTGRVAPEHQHCHDEAPQRCSAGAAGDQRERRVLWPLPTGAARPDAALLVRLCLSASPTNVPATASHYWRTASSHHECTAWLSYCRPPAPRADRVNCTWRYIEQPVDHFTDPSTPAPPTYRERYCLYDRYFAKATAAGFDSATDEMAPILFYTGNESPVEEYINNTGLMWNLAKKMGCLVVFAEHRYEGDSFPAMKGEADCVAGGTTAQTY